MSTTALQEAIENLSVTGVYLRSATLWQHDDFDLRLTNKDLLVQSRAGSTVMHDIEAMDEISGKPYRLFKVQFDCGLRLADPDRIKDDDPGTGLVIEIQATFVAEYKVTDGSDLSREAKEAFAQANAGYHVWPYWREYVQSTCARVGLPVIAVPMYRVPKENQRQDKPKRNRKKTTP